MSISPDGTTILDADGTSLGTTARTAFARYLTGARHPGITGIGEATLRRALITRLSATGETVATRLIDPSILNPDRGTLLSGNPGRDGDSRALRDGRGGRNEDGLLNRALYSSAGPVNPGFYSKLEQEMAANRVRDQLEMRFQAFVEWRRTICGRRWSGDNASHS